MPALLLLGSGKKSRRWVKHQRPPFPPSGTFHCPTGGRHGLHPNGYSLDDHHHDSRGGFPWLRGVRTRHIESRPMTVLIYVDTSKQVGDPDHLKVSADRKAAEAWFAERFGRRGV